MKKVIKRAALLLLCMALLLSLGSGVLAVSDTAAAKLSELSVANGYTLVPQDIDGKAITAAEGVYSEVEKLQLGFTAAAGTQYAVFLLSGSEVPTESNIRYIDQISGTGAAASVTIFPDQMAAAGTYYVYVSTASAYTKVASFTVAAAEPEYTLGDADGDGDVDAVDASVILRYLVGDEELNTDAADVDKNGQVSAVDASMILRYLVGLEDF